MKNIYWIYLAKKEVKILNNRKIQIAKLRAIREALRLLYSTSKKEGGKVNGK